jgi:hypothetical protein
VRTTLLDSLEFFDIPRRENHTCSMFIEFIGQILSNARWGTSDPDDLSFIIRLDNFPANVGDNCIEYQSPNDDLENHRYVIIIIIFNQFNIKFISLQLTYFFSIFKFINSVFSNVFKINSIRNHAEIDIQSILYQESFLLYYSKCNRKFLL